MPTSSHDRLLHLFDGDTVRASEKLERLHARLIRFFEWNHCTCPEDLAQESLMRCTRRLAEGQPVYANDPVNYIFGFAKNVLKEWRERRQEDQLQDYDPSPQPGNPARMNQIERAIYLKQCLASLSVREREILVAYYSGTGEAVCRRHHLTPLGLRLRVHRIKKKLKDHGGGLAPADEAPSDRDGTF